MAIKLFASKKVLTATHIECPSCESISPVEEWNEGTLLVYGSNSPDIRKSALDKISFPYQCPKCHMGYSAHRLTFLHNN